ncbi:MAG: hypothetical protein EPN86_04130 [Nanoarchaeota archaeon]|nr:MAG: hypothetical protein EPN86_04130 [Nanoarchaeota archaeon]
MINEGGVIGQRLIPAIGTLFLLAVVVMLFQTQLGVLDSTSRIMAENWAIKRLEAKKENTINLSRIYYVFLWMQIAFGIGMFLLNIYEPLTLIVVAAVLNAIAMFVHIGMVNWMNYKVLPKELQPAMIRRLVIIVIFIFFGVFSAITVWNNGGSFLSSVLGR